MAATNNPSFASDSVSKLAKMPPYMQLLQHAFTVCISIPSAAALFFVIVQVSKGCIRASTQLNLHCWTWIFYYLTGFAHASYVLSNWQGPDTVYSEAILKITIISHFCFVFLLPWSVLMATIDRCVSLRFPMHYSLFNGETMRTLTVIVSMFILLTTWSWIYYMGAQVDKRGACYLVECLDIHRIIDSFIIYKVVFGFLNLVVTSIFIYLFMNYQIRGRGLDKIRNLMMFLILIAELLFNVIPPLAYWAFYSMANLELIGIFAPIIFASITLDGICTVVVYLSTYKRKQKQFNQCRPRRQTSSTHSAFNGTWPLGRPSIASVSVAARIASEKAANIRSLST